MRIGADNLNLPNVFVDSKNRLYFPEYKESIHPIVFIFHDNNFVEFREFDGAIELP